VTDDAQGLLGCAAMILATGIALALIAWAVRL